MQRSEPVQAMVKLYKSGLSIAEVAQQTGISSATAWRRLSEQGVIRPRSPIPRGEDAARRDSEIIRLYKAGLTQDAIAAQLGIGQTTVSRRLRSLGVDMRRKTFDRELCLANLRDVNERQRPQHIQRDGVAGKVCRKCQAWTPLGGFRHSKVTSDGLENRCRECERVRIRESARRNSDSIAEKRRTPEFREYHRAYCREWERNRRATSVNYRVSKALRGRVRRALRGIRKERPTLELLGCSLDELRQHLESRFAEGMSWDNYGRGGWEIDHIRPCASFDLSNPEQLQQCFHYLNLQPLWGPDNWRKGPRY